MPHASRLMPHASRLTLHAHAPCLTPHASCLRMPEYSMRYVRLFERANLFVIECDVERGDGVVEMMRFRGADDRRGDARLVQEPRKRDLRGRNVAFLGNGNDAIDDVE